MSRTCGSCTSCCVLFAIPDLKPAFVRCPHQSMTRGCKIYLDRGRPKVCDEFHCLWLQGEGFLPENARPDLLGLMFTTGDYGDRVFAHEVYPNSAQHGAANALLKAMAKKIAVTIVPREGGPRRVIGPPDEVAKVVELARWRGAKTEDST